MGLTNLHQKELTEPVQNDDNKIAFLVYSIIEVHIYLPLNQSPNLFDLFTFQPIDRHVNYRLK